MLRLLFAFLLLMFQIPSNAGLNAQIGANYTGFDFSVNQAGSMGWYNSDCNFLTLDINGSVGGSGKFAVYGALSCVVSNTSFGATGSGYLTNVGTIALILDVTGTTWSCTIGLSNLVGSCQLINANMARGTTTIIYRP